MTDDVRRPGVLLLRGDCLARMAELPERSVDLVLTDPPYGTTACKWDAVIPFAPMWSAIARVLKPRGAVVLCASQPFTTDLIASKRAWFRYLWIWRKNCPTGHANAKKRPLKLIEDLVVFSPKAPPYFPQGLVELATPKVSARPNYTETLKASGFRAGHVQTHTGYPRNVLEFPVERGLHPTQKPVALMRYMVETYTEPGQIVLDFCMGSGTTGVASLRAGRSFVGIERHGPYFEAASARILDGPAPLRVAA